MRWNYRVLADDSCGDVVFEIYEVYYDKNGNPNGYSEKPSVVISDNKKGLRWQMNAMKKALDKPVLFSGDKFPKEYKNTK